MYPENDDICLFINNESEIISSLNDSSVLTNLRARFERKIFYVSAILNPEILMFDSNKYIMVFICFPDICFEGFDRNEPI